jgi:hypothetical protein
MAYLLDADTFIQAKNLHYGFDFCPGFWDWIVRENAAGRVFSIEKVGDELEAGSDELASWTQARGRSLFLPPDDAAVSAMGKVSTWVQSHGYAPAAVNAFFQVADYYLVGEALALGYTVVTHEVPAPQAIRKIKIPDVCIGLKIKCVSPFEMLRKERARFVLR